MAVLPLLVQLPLAVARPCLTLWSWLRLGWLERAARERLAQSLVRVGDLAGALETHRQGVERALPRGGYALAQAATLYGNTLLYGGWFAEGAPYLEAVLTMLPGWPAGPLRDLTALQLASAQASRGEPEVALRSLETLDAPAREGDRGWQASLRIVRGHALQIAGKPEASINEYRAALVAAGRNAQRRAVIGNNLAGVQMDVGDLAGAGQSLGMAEAIKASNPVLTAHLAGTRAELELRRGDLVSAHADLERSTRLKESAGAVGGIGWTLATRAWAAALAGSRGDAYRLLEEARPKLQTRDAAGNWSRAATALGIDGKPPPLVEAPPDPLLDRVRAAARPLPVWLARRQQYIQVAIGLLLGLAVGWLVINLI